MAESILIVDDEEIIRESLSFVLKKEGYSVQEAENGKVALEYIKERAFDLVITDIEMPEMKGIELMENISRLSPETMVVVITAYGSIESAIAALRRGAIDYVLKPVEFDELLVKTRRLLGDRRMRLENKLLRSEIHRHYDFDNIIGKSSAMQRVFETIKKVAQTDGTVLITGKSGTGKELVARALHYNSNRSEKPFVAVNCSAIPENLLESELFGHEKGAFTGAMKQKAGKFEEGNGGTLFLDEIGDLAPTVQTKLLRVLQEKIFERVGGNTPIKVDTRIVAATNRNLEMMTRDGDFREDLFFRLNVFPIHLPPLRERLEDIPMLAEHFLTRHADLSGGRVKSISPLVITDMMNYNWRGNIRELENLMKRAIIKTTGETIMTIELPTNEHAPSTAKEPIAEVDLNTPYKDYISAIVRDAEEKYLTRMLRLYKGNINQIAKLMEIDRKTVYRKMAEYSIDPATFREAN